jgi:hypothetical protein
MLMMWFLTSIMRRLNLLCDAVFSIQNKETFKIGAIAQLGVRLVCNQEVGGSIPPGSTNLHKRV